MLSHEKPGKKLVSSNRNRQFFVEYVLCENIQREEDIAIRDRCYQSKLTICSKSLKIKQKEFFPSIAKVKQDQPKEVLCLVWQLT